MNTSNFDFDLPKKFIAQEPVVPRDSSKLLVFDTESGRIFHKRFYEITDFLSKDDLLVFNRSKVIPARINFIVNDGIKEIFVLKILDKNRCIAFVKPGRFFKTGKQIKVNDTVNCLIEKVFDDGRRLLNFNHDYSSFYELLDFIGKTPLPPYIEDNSENYPKYQTTYAKEKGSVAAPTAGLHFTENLFSNLNMMGVGCTDVVLHVGAGTFLPVSVEDLDKHVMHSETFFIPAESKLDLNNAVGSKRIISVGTTSVRVLESTFDLESSTFDDNKGETDIFIYPGAYKWKIVDGLITNFHLPKSTLIMLVASFLEAKGVDKPIEKILEIYELAKANNYRFYSFGDSMMII